MRTTGSILGEYYQSKRRDRYNKIGTLAVIAVAVLLWTTASAADAAALAAIGCLVLLYRTLL